MFCIFLIIFQTHVFGYQSACTCEAQMPFLKTSRHLLLSFANKQVFLARLLIEKGLVWHLPCKLYLNLAS